MVLGECRTEQGSPPSRKRRLGGTAREDAPRRSFPSPRHERTLAVKTGDAPPGNGWKVIRREWPRRDHRVSA